MKAYKTYYDEGLEPTPKMFLYNEDTEMSAFVVGLMDEPYELSPNWKEFYEVIKGNGPCNRQRMDHHLQVHEDGAWVREAAQKAMLNGQKPA